MTSQTQTGRLTNLAHVIEVDELTVDRLRKSGAFMGLRAGQTRRLLKPDVEHTVTMNARQHGYEVVIMRTDPPRRRWFETEAVRVFQFALRATCEDALLVRLSRPVCGQARRQGMYR